MRRMWLVGLLLVAASVLPLLVEAGPEPQGKGLRTVRLMVFNIDAATTVARNLGFFAAEGLDVDITITPSSTVQMRGLSEGTWDVAGTAFDNVLAWSGREGAEIVAVAQTEGRLELPVYVRPEIREWADLRGRPLAVDAVDTAYALVLRRLLLEYGLELERGDYTLVPAGAPVPRVESMARGETFAGIINPPTDVRARAEGLQLLGDHLAVLPEYPGSGMAVRRTWAAQNAETLTGFLRAWRAGAQWAQANRERALELVATDQGISREAAAGRLATLSTDGALNVAGLQIVLDLRTQFATAPRLGTDIGRYYDLRYHQAAQPR